MYVSTKKKKINTLLFLIPLLGLCISLKTYFLPYLFLGFLLVLINIKNSKILNKIFLSKSFLFFLILLILNFSHHFISTGMYCVTSTLYLFRFNVIWGKNIN